MHQLGVSLEDLYNGVTRKLALQKNVICGKCEGKISSGFKHLLLQDFLEEHSGGLGTKYDFLYIYLSPSPPNQAALCQRSSKSKVLFLDSVVNLLV